jgi:hypothetical protein
LFGGGGLWVALPHPDLRAARWPGGTYGLKIGWWRGFEGELELRARSLRSGETVTWRAGGGYGPRGFQPSSFGLPRTGCWLVTGILGGTRVNVVLDVRAG